MTGPVILRDVTGDQPLTMSRPDPPESDTIVKRSSAGDRIVFVFSGYDNDVPVYAVGGLIQ